MKHSEGCCDVDGKKPCYNCGLEGHDSRDCDQEKADCDICGLAAGHKNVFCLAQCKREIPPSIPSG
eukprot:2951560-Prymnesium_polylepis.1